MKRIGHHLTRLTCPFCEADLEVDYTVSDIIEVMDVTVLVQGDEPGCSHGWAEGSEEPDWMLPFLERAYREDELDWLDRARNS